MWLHCTTWHRSGQDPDPHSSTKGITECQEPLRDQHQSSVGELSTNQPTLCAEVRHSSQEADSQYIEEGSLSKRMFSEVTFPNSFLSFPAS